MSNLYKDYYKQYTQNGFSVIPAKFGSKMPAIKSWSDYCYRMPTKEEQESWSKNFSETNLDVALGEASGIIALDIDCEDEKILELIMPLLPTSPVVKKGSKGETRFFKFTGEMTDIVKFNGSVVVELLSNGKKTTLPPSKHPNGMLYKWNGMSLLDIDKNSLPLFPPFTFVHLQNKLQNAFPDAISAGFGKVKSGRNDELSSLCGKLISENKTVDEVIHDLIKFDKDNNDPPLFTDTNELRHSEAYTNALTFYTNHLNSINYKRFRDQKEYEVPAMATVGEDAKKVLETTRLGKSQRQGRQKRAKERTSPVNSVNKTMLCNCPFCEAK